MLKTKLEYRFRQFKSSAHQNQRQMTITMEDYELLLEAKSCAKCEAKLDDINIELRRKYGDKADEQFMTPWMMNPDVGWVKENCIPLCKKCLASQPLLGGAIRSGDASGSPSLAPHAPSGLSSEPEGKTADDIRKERTPVSPKARKWAKVLEYKLSYDEWYTGVQLKELMLPEGSEAVEFILPALKCLNYERRGILTYKDNKVSFKRIKQVKRV